jgi:hypothetical protein
MDQERPDAPVEVLETGRPTGVLERWTRAALARPSARAVLVLGVALCLLGAWVAVRSDSSPPAEPQAEAAAAGVPPGLRPPPLRAGSGPRDTSGWKAPLDLAVRSGPHGHTITFFAVNRGTQPLDPRWFVVSAGFVDQPELAYKASCTGLRPGTRRPIRGTVPPGMRILVRCDDTTAYQGDPAWIDPPTIVVRAGRCEDSEAGAGV